jgi:hypothetical protein
MNKILGTAGLAAALPLAGTGARAQSGSLRVRLRVLLK